MRNRTPRHASVTALLLLVTFFALPALAQYTAWQQIPIPPLHPFHPQEPKRIVLSSGMVIFLQEDHELPFINGSLRIRGGSRDEPGAKTGLVDLYGEVWRTGGTKAQTGDQMDDFLESRAAKVETSGGGDSTTFGWSCLKGDFDAVFKLAIELLREPEFRPDKLELAQKEAFDEISRRNDNPGQIAGRESLKLAYGANSPYARSIEYKTIAAVTREDLIAWHKQHVHPNNIIVGVTGDFDSGTMEATLRKAFESWPKGPAAPKENPAIDPAKPGYYLVAKDDVNQSNIRMVELGTDRRNPDYYAIEVFNEAFGGGFSSRLFQDIRTKRGLAYAVGGGIGTAFDHPGVVRLVMSTKSQSTAESIQALYENIDELKTKPITDEEIKRAKDSILNSFIFNFDTPEKVLRERMAYEFYGYPPDFLEKYRAGVEKVTAADVNRIPGKYLHKDQLAVLVVGNDKDFDKPLSSLGPVTNVDITIPPPPAETNGESADASPAPASAAMLPTASNAEGKALARKAADAMASADKLKSIHGLQAKLQQEGQPPIDVTILYPDHMQVAIETPGGPMSMVATPKAAFMAAQGQVRDLPESRKKESLEQIKRDLVFIAQHAVDPSFFFAANGSERIGDVQASIVDINAQGTAMRWYIDPKTGRILRETYPAMGQSGPVQGQTDLADWKDFDGVTLPAKRLNKQKGQDSSVVEFLDIHFNPQVDAKVFEKPAASGSAQ
jgi:zinc protease